MPDDREIALRQAARLHLITNPNYFGNLTELKLPNLPKAVLQKTGDTAFEELTCLGYNPASSILTAVVRVKQGAGYSGGPCTEGSREWVRFYLDYGDGVWVDHGAASFEIHDLGFKDPLCYAVSLKIAPRRRSCCDAKPVLPTVRAILSWNVEPPAGMPAWLPVWGNRLERHVQVAPRSWFLCHFLDKIDVAGLQKLDPAKLEMATAALEALPDEATAVASLPELMKAGGDDKMLPLRHIYPMLAKMAPPAGGMGALAALSPLGIDLAQFGDFLANPKFDTTFEEITCVGLDRDATVLHGTVVVKRPSGYSGGLCTAGSREYVAFYLDFGAGWEYMGTSWVQVHDVAVPRGGLWYDVALPVNLDKHRQEWCQTGRARIRGILSWQVAPPPGVPEFVPHWGDREDCFIEVKPFPQGVIPGKTMPVLEAIGSIPLPAIAATGYATGGSVGGTFTAKESPFGGVMKFTGVVANQGATKLEYRVMVKGPSDPSFVPFNKTFPISVTTVSGGSVSIASQNQIAVADWYPYVPETVPVFRSVAENLLAPYTAGEEGLHYVYLDIRLAGSLVVLASTPVQAFMVDNSAPVVDIEITSGAGNCGKFKVGEVIVGTYAMADKHAQALTIKVTPAPEATGGHLAITQVIPAAATPPTLPDNSASNSLDYFGTQMLTVGADGKWELDTTGMKPCGYNVWIIASDRTVVNSSGVHWTAQMPRGFCLE